MQRGSRLSQLSHTGDTMQVLTESPAHTKRVNTAINNIKPILVMALTHHEELGVLAQSKCYFVSLFNGKTLYFGGTKIPILTVIFEFTPNH